ncbi:unnamed protein product [Dicrocoelium dendriticum]|nr:unnamed protein product [Dicrocoelium dendriticum]
MVARGGPVPPMGPGAGRGYGGPAFHGGGGPPVDYRGTTDGRPPRGGRGGFRGGPSAAYGGPVDSSSMYGAPHSQFDVPTGKNAPTDPYGAAGGGSFSSIVDSKPPESTGGYRGAYGPPSRGQYGGSSDSTGYGGQAMGRGANIASGRGGRGAGPGDRDGPAIARGGHVPRGASAVRGGYSANTHGGYQGDADASGYPIAGADRTPTYSSYQGTEDYSERARDRFPVSDTGSYGSVNQQAKNSGSFPVPRQSGYSGGYHRGGPPSYPTGGQQSYPVPTGNYSSESQAAYSGSYTGAEGYSNSGVPEGVRGARSTGHSAGGSQGVSSRGYPSSDTEKPPIDAQHNERAPDAGSLYASGSARYGETQATQPSAGGPKQSRFDSKPAPAGPQGYSSYPPGSYSGPYGATYGGGTMNNPGGGTQPTAPNSANLRNARSRFDLGPSANQATSASAAGPQDTQSQSSGQSQQPPSQPSVSFPLTLKSPI